METESRPTWPHLENIDRIKAESPEWFDQGAEWVVTEKMHGFNARFGRDLDDVLWVGSRTNIVAEGDPAKWPDSLQGFVRFAASSVSQLLVGETVFGEQAYGHLPDAIFRPGEPDSHIPFTFAQAGKKCGQEFAPWQGCYARSMAVVEQRVTLRQQKALFRIDQLHTNAFLY